jgi:hypothetical protein
MPSQRENNELTESFSLGKFKFLQINLIHNGKICNFAKYKNQTGCLFSLYFSTIYISIMIRLKKISLSQVREQIATLPEDVNARLLGGASKTTKKPSTTRRPTAMPTLPPLLITQTPTPRDKTSVAPPPELPYKRKK